MALDSIPVLSGALPVVGHGPEFIRDRFAVLDRIIREVADVGRLRFFTRDLVCVNSPASTHEVLVSNARSFAKSPMIRVPLAPFTGEGLFTSDGALWRRQRRLMAPVFQHAKIDAFADTMVACAEDASARWQDGSVLDLAEETTQITMNVAGRNPIRHRHPRRSPGARASADRGSAVG